VKKRKSRRGEAGPGGQECQLCSCTGRNKFWGPKFWYRPIQLFSVKNKHVKVKWPALPGPFPRNPNRWERAANAIDRMGDDRSGLRSTDSLAPLTKRRERVSTQFVFCRRLFPWMVDPGVLQLFFLRSSDRSCS
jgi:hypothetical protein